MCFTLSQAGMVVHWFKYKDDPSWKRSAVVNAVGAITTGIVFTRHRGRQVHRGRLDRRGARPDHGRVLHVGEAALRHGPCRAGASRRRARRPQLAVVQPSAQPRDRAGEEHRPPPRARAAVRQDAARRHRSRRSSSTSAARRRPAFRKQWDEAEHGHQAHRHRVAVPRGHLAGRSTTCATSRGRPRTTSSPSSCRSTRR